MPFNRGVVNPAAGAHEAEAPHDARRQVDTIIARYEHDLQERLANQTVELGREVCRRKQAEKALRESQHQLMHSEKMASIGQLAAGVAHEINNPVGFVMNNLATLREYVAVFKRLLNEYDGLAAAAQTGKVAEQEQTLRRIDEIRRAEDLPYILGDVDQLLSESTEGTERVRDIVQSLKSFAHVDEAHLEEADLNEAIEDTLKIVWNELKYKCHLHKRLGQIPLIRCNVGQLNHVFMNLLVNAAQAIPEHGEITIETEAVGGHVEVRVSDTGVGIPAENIPRLFDPFFTTKEVGKGTGLGLSISLGIVQKHNGTIDVASEVGKGTTFTVRLPIDGAPFASAEFAST